MNYDTHLELCVDGKFVTGIDVRMCLERLGRDNWRLESVICDSFPDGTFVTISDPKWDASVPPMKQAIWNAAVDDAGKHTFVIEQNWTYA